MLAVTIFLKNIHNHIWSALFILNRSLKKVGGGGVETTEHQNEDTQVLQEITATGIQAEKNDQKLGLASQGFKERVY